MAPGSPECLRQAAFSGPRPCAACPGRQSAAVEALCAEGHASRVRFQHGSSMEKEQGRGVMRKAAGRTESPRGVRRGEEQPVAPVRLLLRLAHPAGRAPASAAAALGPLGSRLARAAAVLASGGGRVAARAALPVAPAAQSRGRCAWSGRALGFRAEGPRPLCAPSHGTASLSRWGPWRADLPVPVSGSALWPYV